MNELGWEGLLVLIVAVISEVFDMYLPETKRIDILPTGKSSEGNAYEKVFS